MVLGSLLLPAVLAGKVVWGFLVQVSRIAEFEVWIDVGQFCCDAQRAWSIAQVRR